MRVHRRTTTTCWSASRSSGWRRRASWPPTGTGATGRAWTRSATRWCSRADWESGNPRGRSGDRRRRRRILVTGNMGYVGPAWSRTARAYPEATLLGLDTGLFAHCLTGCAGCRSAALDAQHFADVRAVPARRCSRAWTPWSHLAASRTTRSARPSRRSPSTSTTAPVGSRDAGEGGRVPGAFVFASSCSVYGSAEDERRDRGVAPAAADAYARSKCLTERGAGGAGGRGFAVTCLRFATACGMSDRLRLDLVLTTSSPARIASRTITHPQRRHAVAAADPRPRHGPRDRVGDRARADRRWSLPGASTPAPTSGTTGSGTWPTRWREVIPGVDVSLASTSGPDKRSYRVSFARFRELAPDHQPRGGAAGRRSRTCGTGSSGWASPTPSSGLDARAARRHAGPARARALDRRRWTDCGASQPRTVAWLSTPHVPVVRRAAPAHLRRPRDARRSPTRTSARGRAATQARAVLPAARATSASVLPRPARGDRGARADLLRLRVLLVVLGELGASTHGATSRR